jgi:hypothetical protein
VRNPISHPYKTTGKTMLYEYISVSEFLGRRQTDRQTDRQMKDSELNG